MDAVNPPSAAKRSALASIRSLLRSRASRERCELCSADLADEHAHLVEIGSGRVLCACDACAILFTNQVAGKYRRVPRRVVALPELRLTDAQWASLHIPITLAYLFHSTRAGGKVAHYPSPAGATEASLDEAAWEYLAQENPVLRELEPDVEALLVNKVGSAPLCFRAPIDECYRLTGLVRRSWRGFSGGPEVWRDIEQFFQRLRERAGPSQGALHG
jgi:hypothetical protein